MKAEIAVLEEITPDIPVTTNFMTLYDGLDYRRMAPELDVISWDVQLFNVMIKFIRQVLLKTLRTERTVAFSSVLIGNMP